MIWAIILSFLSVLGVFSVFYLRSKKNLKKSILETINFFKEDAAKLIEAALYSKDEKNFSEKIKEQFRGEYYKGREKEILEFLVDGLSKRYTNALDPKDLEKKAMEGINESRAGSR